MAKAEPRSITRRWLVAALALPVVSLLPLAVPLLPAVASALPPPDFASAQSGLPTTPDPIFAAIEAHERAFAELNAFLHELAAVEQAAWHAPRGQRRAANKRLREARDDEGRSMDLLIAATERLVATVPVTLEGAAAALAYVRARHAEGDDMCEEENFLALIGATEQAIRAAMARAK